jgi:hypothetical protein
MDSLSKLAQLRVKKKKPDEELAKEVDVYDPITWNDTVDEEAQDKNEFKRKYRKVYDRMKEKQS